MKIVIPDYTSPDSFADNVAHTLRAMGHSVITMDGPPRLRRARALYQRMRRNLGRDYLDPRERWLLRCAREHRPDMLLAVTQCIAEDALRELRKYGVGHRIAWWADAPANLSIMGMGLLSEEWDLICMKDPDGVAKLRRVGLRAKLLHEAMNPAWHRPIAGCRNDDVVVVGNYYGYRQFLVAKLEQNGVRTKLYGSALPVWALPEVLARHEGRYVVREEKSRIFGEALLCLNSTSLAEGNSLNCRAFEVAGAGGLQLVEPKPILAECFDPGREVLVFNSFADAIDLVERARRCPEEMNAIRERAARRALAQHTYRHRLEAILKWANEA